MSFSERYNKAIAIDKQVESLEKLKNARLKIVDSSSSKIEDELKELKNIRQTLPPKVNEFPNSLDLGKNVAFWAGGSFESAIHTLINYKDTSNIQGRELAGCVISHEGGLVANNAFIRGTIMATDGVFSGTIYANEGRFSGMVSIANGKILLNTDGSGQLASGNIRWDKDGNIQVVGKYQSETSGNRFEIDPENESLFMYDKNGNVSMRLWYSENLSLLQFFFGGEATTQINAAGIYLRRGQLTLDYDQMWTEDPKSKGVVWRDGNDLKISAG